MRKLTTLLLGAGMLVGTAAAAHASETTGYISLVYTMPDGQVLFHTSNPRQQPACATVQGRWAFNGATAAGQARLAVLMTAYALHKPVYVLGTGACEVWSDTESVNWLRTQDP